MTPTADTLTRPAGAHDELDAFLLAHLGNCLDAPRRGQEQTRLGRAHEWRAAAHPAQLEAAVAVR
ncbi:MAG: hypothetical protein U1E73_11540 [Planctomycetota bacterium]